MHNKGKNLFDIGFGLLGSEVGRNHGKIIFYPYLPSTFPSGWMRLVQQKAA